MTDREDLYQQAYAQWNYNVKVSIYGHSPSLAITLDDRAYAALLAAARARRAR